MQNNRDGSDREEKRRKIEGKTARYLIETVKQPWNTKKKPNKKQKKPDSIQCQKVTIS